MPVNKEFAGDCPDRDAYLMFRNDLSFKLEFLQWDETSKKETSSIIAGRWWQIEEQLFLEFDEQRVSLKVANFRQQTPNGLFTGLRLENTGTGLDGCHFVYRELNFN